MSREELLHECRDIFERQCRSHCLDPTDPMIRGVFNNLMQYILAEWEIRERRLKGEVRA